MEVHDDESLANHIGSEPCTYGGDTMGEASVGECIGQPLSREKSNWDADAVDPAEGNMDMYAIASAWPILRGPRPWHVQTLLAWKPGDLATGLRIGPQVRAGKASCRSR